MIAREDILTRLGLPFRTVVLCTGAYRLSKRTTQQVMDDLFGVPMRVGTISQSEKATTAV